VTKVPVGDSWSGPGGRQPGAASGGPLAHCPEIVTGPVKASPVGGLRPALTGPRSQVGGCNLHRLVPERARRTSDTNSSSNGRSTRWHWNGNSVGPQ